MEVYALVESLLIAFEDLAARCVVTHSFIGRIDPESRGSPIG